MIGKTGKKKEIHTKNTKEEKNTKKSKEGVVV
jgi:hypothetical protein